MVKNSTIIEHGNAIDDDQTEYMLTTLDNPFNPFEQWDEWYSFDASKDYYTTNYLARIARTSQELSDADQRLAINQAIDDILRLDVLGIYVKVTAENWKDRSKETNFPVVTVVKT